ncbi:hypothetical protein V500_01930 [Pseudogymnoascus sp. VKM F-4518 (FW-2643)]|nr:hypothetical protein V500_01930 [Pseudogymnoascus sp. VKM F-4518 (FW-2643)]
MATMEASTGLRRKDTTKGAPLRVLSLDGGGVRGYSVFIILQELMHRTFVEIEGRAPKRSEIPKPCDHFDLIVGTGTGGLIAIMLGRLRLDLETCKEVYVRMTRKVFETDKTIAGIPYRSTLFKASKLEEAIKECVREHTVFQSEGNDGEAFDDVQSPVSYPLGRGNSARSDGVQRHHSNASMMSFSARGPRSTYGDRKWTTSARYGDANALLYDTRENRTKTAVTAVYQNTPKGAPPALLRSYDSRKEPAPEFNCTIWQAGRATSATGLAFKPIQIGQSVFIDEGQGRFNPSPIALDEVTLNEYPGRPVGTFVSIGTGKRPANTDATSHLWYDDILGDFAEARRRLIAKIEGCETTHLSMPGLLAARNVEIDSYIRLNVEIGVGDFGMNEWARLADISTSTRRYLARPDVQAMSLNAATRLARIYLTRLRGRDPAAPPPLVPPPRDPRRMTLQNVPETPYPSFAAELPAEVPPGAPAVRPSSRRSYDLGAESLGVPSPVRGSPRTSDDGRPVSALSTAPTSSTTGGSDRLTSHAPTPAQYWTAGGRDKIAIVASDEVAGNGRMEPPPLPPKTPIMGVREHRRGASSVVSAMGPPYPLDDGPPPVVNMARKPEWSGR